MLMRCRAASFPFFLFAIAAFLALFCRRVSSYGGKSHYTDGIHRVSTENSWSSNENSNERFYATDKQQKWRSISRYLQLGHVFQHRYDSQTISGYAPWVSVQRAMGRFQALVSFEMVEPGEVTMILSECLIGQLNGHPSMEWNPAKLLPVSMFESVTQFSHVHLERPVRFTFSRAGIHNVYFDPMEPAWSRNMKKAILSMGQFRLEDIVQQQKLQTMDDEQKQQTMDDEQKQNNTTASSTATEWDEQQQRHKEEQLWMNKWQRTYTVRETSIEGDCETDYTMVPFSAQLISMTKSINFDRCTRLADTTFRMQADDEAKQRAEHYQHPRRKQIGGANALISRQFLDRSTTVRYSFFNLASNALHNGSNLLEMDPNLLVPQSVELLSQYTLKGSEAEQSQAMQTVAVAKMTFIGTKQQQQKNIKRRLQRGDKSWMEREQLLYNAEMEQQEKCFFMFGDELPETGKCQRQAKAFNNGEPKTTATAGSRMPSPGSPFVLNFPNSTSKIQLAEYCLRKVAQSQASANDGTVQALSRTELMDEAVQVLRFSTEQELKQMKDKVDDDRIAFQLFADALAAAGTRNTLKMLLTRIEQDEFTDLKAAQMLKTFSRGCGLVAPSDRIADALLALCKSKRVQSSELLRQTSWLSFGAIVGELMQMKRIQRQCAVGTPLGEIEQCPDHKMELYSKALLEQFSTGAGDDIVEKAIALKAIGNAALDEVPDELANLISRSKGTEEQRKDQPTCSARDQQHELIIRQNAIEAIRRIPSEKVQRLLLPIFVNQQECPQTRLSALNVLMQSQLSPTDSVIEQIAFTMAKEHCSQMLAYAHSTLQALSKSPAKRHQKNAQRIKEALLMAGVDKFELEQRIRQNAIVGLSSFTQTNALFSDEEGQGILLQASKVFTDKTSALPTHSFFSLSSLFNGQMSEEQLKLTINQQNIEQLLFSEAGLNKLLKETDENGQNIGDQQRHNSTEQQQSPEQSSASLVSSAADQLRALWRRLSIVGRSDDQQSSDADQQPQQQPFVVLSLRVNNIDTVVLPIGTGGQKKSNSVVGTLKKLLMVGIGSVAQLTGIGQRQRALDASGILFWHERSARVPMSTGQQLHIQHKSFAFGTVKANAGRLGQSQIALQLHPTATFGRIQKMKVWASPVHSAGVKHIGAIDVNLPLTAQLNTLSQQKQFKLNVQVPQTLTRLFSFHTLPLTFIGTENMHNSSPYQPSVFLHFGEQCKSVQNQQLSSMAWTFDEHSDTEQSLLQIPFRLKGLLHTPRRMDKLKEWAKTLLSAENHCQLSLEESQKGGGRSPHEIAFYLSWNLFQRQISRGGDGISRAEFKELLKPFIFVAASKNIGQQSPAGEEADGDEEQPTSASSSEQNSMKEEQRRIGAYLEQLGEQKAYKHTLKASMETVGSDRNRRAELRLNNLCDKSMRLCVLHAQLQRSVGQRQQQWTADLQMQSLFPTQAPDLKQYNQTDMAQQQNTFMSRADLEWKAHGQPKQSISVGVKGEPSAAMLQQLAHQFVADEQNAATNTTADNAEQHGLPFVDKYTLVADWRLKRTAQNVFLRCLEAVKSAHFFNTASTVILAKNEEEDSGDMAPEKNVPKLGDSRNIVQRGRTMATLSIDPTTRRHFNMTIRSPQQLTVFHTVQLASAVRPFPLIGRHFPRGAILPNSSPAASVALPQLLHQMALPLRSRAVCRLNTLTSQLQTFDGAQLDTPMPTCWTVLAKDCSAEGHTQYAVLIKAVSNSDQMKLKVITPEIGIVMVEPNAQQPDTKLQFQINGKKWTNSSETPLADIPNGIEFVQSSAGKEAVTIESATSGTDPDNGQPIGATGALSVHFDGQKVRIWLNGQQNRHQSCGLCGNWNNNAGDELRMPNGRQTDNVKELQRAYSLVDEEGEENGECDEHSQILDKFHTQQTEKAEQEVEESQQQQQKDDEGTPMAQQIAAVPKTLLHEYPHQLCFSLHSVKHCPHGTLTVTNDGIDNEKNEQRQKREEQQPQPKQQKVPFTCVERHTVEAKRFRNQARRGEIVQFGDRRPISFQEVVIEPSECIIVKG